MTCKEVMEAVVGFGPYCLWNPQQAPSEVVLASA